MKQYRVILSLTIVMIFFSLVNSVDANEWNVEQTQIKNGVFIPEDEYIGYFDSNGIFTVVGAIKNTEDYPVTPTIKVNIQDVEKIISESFEYVPILPSQELPFKVKFPEIISKSIDLLEPEISFIPAQKNPLNVEVIYDETLITHDDGHLTGRIINNGDTTVHNIKVFAIIHGYEKVLDMGQNFEIIEKMEPGEIRNFSMYPDPSISDEVFYYSCFAPTDSTIVPMTTTRNGEKFFFRYDSGSWYYGAEFNEAGTELSMNTYFSFQLETYANFELPYFNDNEKFEVFLNGEPKKSIQSIDEMGNWHVAFNVEPKETGIITIKGFDPNWIPTKTLIPNWITLNAKLWSDDEFYQYDFVRGINFLISEQVIEVPLEDFEGKLRVSIPDWVRVPVGWWAEGLITDEEFINSMKNLIEREIIML